MSELEQIEGIGPKTKELLEKLGIYTIEDLVNHYPFRYEVIRRSNLEELKDGAKVTIDGVEYDFKDLLQPDGSVTLGKEFFKNVDKDIHVEVDFRRKTKVTVNEISITKRCSDIRNILKSNRKISPRRSFNRDNFSKLQPRNLLKIKYGKRCCFLNAFTL